jgi:Flp pilus assembly protein TadD
VRVIKSEVGRALQSLWVPSVSLLTLAAMAMSGALAASLPLFAGITGLETRTDSDHSAQIVTFSADMPFQYQMQILDKNHVVFRLYNARLATNLLTPEGGVNLLASGAVESARLRASSQSQSPQDAYQEIVLTGPGLGTKHFHVQGATELPLVRPLAAVISKQPANAALEKFASRPVPPGQPVKLVGKHPAKALPNLNTLQRSVAVQAVQKAAPNTQAMALMALSASDSPSSIQAESIARSRRIEIEPSESPHVGTAMQVASASGPQIETLTNTTGHTRDEMASTAPTQVDNPEQSDNQPMVADPQAQPPEPQYEMMMPVPRYQGGALPIQATTLDTEGHPVVVHPKNAPIPEFDVSRRNGGYNALFQAEPAPDPQSNRVDTLVSDALSLYRREEYPAAEQMLQQALQLTQSNADLYAALAEIQLKLNHTEAAVQSYRQASQLAPNQYGHSYAQALVQAGKRQEAIRVLETLNRQYPAQEQVVYMLGTLHEELGQVDQALDYLKQAAQLHPASADIQYNLGLAYELSGESRQAETHYRSALALNPKATDIAKALARVRK